MYSNLTLQVPITLPSVFSKMDSVFLREDTQKCAFDSICPRKGFQKKVLQKKLNQRFTLEWGGAFWKIELLFTLKKKLWL